jgi:hypothetical protein
MDEQPQSPRWETLRGLKACFFPKFGTPLEKRPSHRSKHYLPENSSEYIVLNNLNSRLSPICSVSQFLQSLIRPLAKSPSLSVPSISKSLRSISSPFAPSPRLFGLPVPSVSKSLRSPVFGSRYVSPDSRDPLSGSPLRSDFNLLQTIHLLLNKLCKFLDVTGREIKFNSGCFINFGYRTGITQGKGIHVILQSFFRIFLIIFPYCNST